MDRILRLSSAMTGHDHDHHHHDMTIRIVRDRTARARARDHPDRESYVRSGRARCHHQAYETKIAPTMAQVVAKAWSILLQASLLDDRHQG